LAENAYPLLSILRLCFRADAYKILFQDLSETIGNILSGDKVAGFCVIVSCPSTESAQSRKAPRHGDGALP